MLYAIGTHSQLQAIKTKIPALVFHEISAIIDRLNDLYGKERDFYEVGGYVFFAEIYEDIEIFQREYLDYSTHPCEWCMAIKDSEYLLALFVLNNDFAITLIMHRTIIPKEILEDL